MCAHIRSQRARVQYAYGFFFSPECASERKLNNVKQMPFLSVTLNLSSVDMESNPTTSENHIGASLLANDK